VKARYGSWIKTAFTLLARLKGLRGTPFDVFGYSEERKLERELIHDYEALIRELLTTLSPKNHRVAVELASLPERIRGYGHVKAHNIALVAAEREKLLQQLRQANGVSLAA